MANVEDYWLQTSDVKLYGREWNHASPARGVLCLVHGLGEHSGRYAHVAEFFCGHGFSFMTFDLRGHGKSSGLRGHVDDFDIYNDDVDNLIQEANRRHPQLPVFLYGHSLGGNIVLNYSLSRKPQIKGVISSSPFLGLAYDPGFKLIIGKTLYSLLPKFSMANGLDRNGLSRDVDVVERYNKDPLVHDMVSARLGLDLINSGKWIIEHAREFPLPLLLMQGSADWIVSSDATREFAAKLPAGLITYKEWEGGYHELHNDIIKEDVLQTMQAWLVSNLK